MHKGLVIVQAVKPDVGKVKAASPIPYVRSETEDVVTGAVVQGLTSIKLKFTVTEEPWIVPVTLTTLVLVKAKLLVIIVKVLVTRLRVPPPNKVYGRTFEL